MHLFPDFSFEWYGGWWLSLVFLIISFSLTAMIPKHNLIRFVKVPKLKYFNLSYVVVYYLQLALLTAVPLVENPFLKTSGIILYVIGILLYTAALYSFSISEYDKPVVSGVYSFSRHPVYTSFFIIIAGASIATGSLLLLLINIVHLGVAYFIAKREELECSISYGNSYDKYKSEVRMFL
ncbi:MAG: methyltransferase [Bacteroidota bacterium]|nr:methyltransferase [Bacteroidota bacterium]